MIQNKNLQKTIKLLQNCTVKKPYKTVCSSYVQIIIKKCIEQAYSKLQNKTTKHRIINILKKKIIVKSTVILMIFLYTYIKTKQKLLQQIVKFHLNN